MASPVKEAMGTMNPVMNMSRAEQMAMNMLKQQNPQGYDMLQQMMASGQNPNDILNQMSSQMSPQQLGQLKQLAAQFGIR